MVGAAQLIPLKARAWLDLTQREKNGARVFWRNSPWYTVWTDACDG